MSLDIYIYIYIYVCIYIYIFQVTKARSEKYVYLKQFAIKYKTFAILGHTPYFSLFDKEWHKLSDLNV